MQRSGGRQDPRWIINHWAGPDGGIEGWKACYCRAQPAEGWGGACLKRGQGTDARLRQWRGHVHIPIKNDYAQAAGCVCVCTHLHASTRTVKYGCYVKVLGKLRNDSPWDQVSIQMSRGISNLKKKVPVKFLMRSRKRFNELNLSFVYTTVPSSREGAHILSRLRCTFHSEVAGILGIFPYFLTSYCQQ